MLEMKRKIIVSEIKKEELRKKLGDFKFEVLQRIWDAYNYLLEKDEVKNVKDLAFNLNRDYTNVNAIINGIRSVTPNIIIDMNKRFGNPFNHEWIIKGEGCMLANTAEAIQRGSTVVNQTWAGNSYNAIVNAEFNRNKTVGESGNIMPNKYGDSLAEKRRWCPVIPKTMAKQPDLDIFGHITKQIGGSLERLYSGTAPVDVWHYVTDNDLYPHYQKGDCLGLKAYEKEDRRIKTGNIYVVDTKRDGLIFRRFRLLDNGDFESYTFSETDPQSYIIPKEDVIRIYSVVLMFRY